MTERLTFNNGRGGHLPNFRALGFIKWAEEQRLAQEMDDLWQRQREKGREARSLTEEIQLLEGEHRKARALAYRGAEAPDEKPLEETREKLERAKADQRDIRKAAEMADADLHKVVFANREKRQAEIEEEMQKDAEEIAALKLELRKREHAYEAKSRLRQWLSDPGQGFGVGSVPIGASA
jgi:hypothetical protein